MNLVRNAVDSLRAKQDGQEKYIRIRGRGWEDRVVLEVRDNGGGVPLELGSLMFNSSVSDKNSTGLGLYLVKMLVSRNGGQVEYLPVEGEVCFRMTFPRGR